MKQHLQLFHTIRGWLACLAILTGHTVAEATIISLGGSTVFQSDQLTPVPLDAFISVGTFDTGFTGFALLPGMTWEEIKVSVYTEVATGVVNPSPGEWAGGGSANGIEGQRLYVWVFDTPAAPTHIGDSEYGLFTGTSAEWIGRGDGDLLHPQFNFLGIQSVDTVFYGTDLGTDIALTGIPEPRHVAMLLGLVSGGFVFLVRRIRG
jgi:hypothetical protein